MTPERPSGLPPTTSSHAAAAAAGTAQMASGDDATFDEDELEEREGAEEWKPEASAAAVPMAYCICRVLKPSSLPTATAAPKCASVEVECQPLA